MNDWKTVFHPGLLNAYWFLIVYLSVLFVQPVLYRNRSEIISRLTAHPEMKLWEKIVNRFSMLFYFGGMVLTVFLPLNPSSFWFWCGTVLFVVCMTAYITAIHNFAAAPTEKPVTGGLYRLSRNPIHFFSAVAWTGIAIASTSWVLLCATLLQLAGMHAGTRAEERYCLEKYGDSYRDYMSRVPRYFLFF